MPASDLVDFSGLTDGAKCFAFVRQHRWPAGARCPGCGSSSVIPAKPEVCAGPGATARSRIASAAGARRALGASTTGRHQPLRVRVLCLCFMGLKLSSRQIALELGLDASGTQAMTEQLRRGLAAKVPTVELTGEVEIDEVYVMAGHKGQPAAVAERGGAHVAAGWQARRAAARWRRTSRRSPA